MLRGVGGNSKSPDFRGTRVHAITLPCSSFLVHALLQISAQQGRHMASGPGSDGPGRGSVEGDVGGKKALSTYTSLSQRRPCSVTFSKMLWPLWFGLSTCRMKTPMTTSLPLGLEGSGGCLTLCCTPQPNQSEASCQAFHSMPRMPWNPPQPRPHLFDDAFDESDKSRTCLGKELVISWNNKSQRGAGGALVTKGLALKLPFSPDASC